MKKSFYSLFLAAIVSLTAVCAHAAEAVSEAVVLKVTGAAQATLPGKAPVDIKAGDKLPQGTIITTPASAEVEIQVFSGNITTIKPSTSATLNKLSITTSNGAVTKQTAEVGLKVGSVIANLDPSKKAINDYSVRTPKGVASARGTIYQVTVSLNGTVRTYVTTGVVVFVNAQGQAITVPPGYAVEVAADGTIGEPAPATEAQQEAADGKNPASPDVIDITTVSPSA